MGYANRLCEDGESVVDAQNYIKAMAGTSAPMALMMMKRQVFKHLNRELGESMEESNLWMDESLARNDFKEGVASFLEKRAPDFQKIEVSD